MQPDLDGRAAGVALPCFSIVTKQDDEAHKQHAQADHSGSIRKRLIPKFFFESGNSSGRCYLDGFGVTPGSECMVTPFGIMPPGLFMFMQSFPAVSL
jgi:hypothetical protein